jgi:FAD/FMN-containing dehydrogenase
MCASSSSTVWQASRVGLDQGCHNWSGSLRFRPSRIEAPRTEQELATLVRTIAAQGRTLRPIGSAHSASPIIVTDDVLVSLDHLKGLYEHDERSQQVTFGAGTKLTEVGERLHSIGLAMPTFGDVATQTVAGAIGSGTHGSGRHLYNLSMVLIGGRLVTADGEVREVSFEQGPDFIRALRVSFGTLGVFSSMRLQLEPIYDLHRQEWCCQIDDCLSRLDEISRENRNFDLYWYPRCDEANLRCLNPPGNEPDYIAFARLIDDRTGPSHKVIPKHSNMPHRFEEMEYALPAEAGLDCFRELRRRIKSKWRRSVAWRLLFRYIKGDDTWLSEAHGRESVSISLHQNSSLPFWDYFTDLEPVFRDYGGRPHWAKKHTLRAEDLRPLYPKWDDFMMLRRRIDPQGVFLTPYFKKLLDA